MHFKTRGEKIFGVFNHIFLIIVCLSCILPILHILALSLSSPHYAMAGQVSFWPRGFTIESYVFAFETGRFMNALWVSIQRSVLGVGLNMLLIVLVAYPLSKPKSSFSARNIYMAFFALTMLFGGGLIPFFILMVNLGLQDTIWALVLPGGLPVFSMLIMMNFIRNMPRELEEAAMIDGAGHFKTLFLILVPVLKPVMATVALFAFVHHWNEWFHGMIFMNDPNNFPLQTFLQTLLVNFRDLIRAAGGDTAQILARLNEQTGRAAQLFLGMLPVIIVYPFLQKHFAKGLIIGSVKG